MLLRKYMSLLGVGSANIDLVLPKDTYHRGELINGYFYIKGGTIEQKVKRIDCDLVMVNQSTGQEKIVDTAIILSTNVINSEECNKISFTFKLPETIQASSEDITYRFKTRLTFNEGVASNDQDFIQVI
ncbi:sporulation protein [Metabacillus sediminilitoris]|uniref:Sporulation protein n=1 Tax=Metabacillus sediminilitoris TaxID=2567941 RepID=A0A4S4BQ17_9BACI|nr:sporulation protein [Metabacillus sediminilitoris]QGQ47743.1 sporulation protein [Metabacillus sediminilitoris]THF76848.1 sporulation protein [Metabacillus sediminilitoris]